MPNRPRATPLARQRAVSLRENETKAEAKLWHHLRNRQLAGHKFRRQFPVETYIADFACVEAGLIVEIDGSQHAKQRDRDGQRDARLRAAGYRVMRFSTLDVVRRTDDVLATLWNALREAWKGTRE